MSHGFGAVTYNYNIAMNYLLDWSEDMDGDGAFEFKAEYNYDQQGNPQFKKYWDVKKNTLLTQENYTWNDRDELVGISGRVTESSVYDYRGLRNIHISNKTNPSGNTTAEYRYLYLQNSQPAFKYNVSDNYYDVFVYEGSKRIARVRINSMGTATKETFINDYQGSPVAVIADDQTIKYQQYNDPWGNMEMTVGVPTSNPEFKYTDKELDEDSGLYYFQARYYDPMGGRFLGRDNIGIENSKAECFALNPYQFNMNNPIRNIDKDGNWSNPLHQNLFHMMEIRSHQGGVLNPGSNTYGYVRTYQNGRPKFHSGLDLAASVGTGVYGAGKGNVVFSGEMEGYGQSIVLKFTYEYNLMNFAGDLFSLNFGGIKNGLENNGKEMYALYSHLSDKSVKLGESVSEGQKIGLTGMSGNAAGTANLRKEQHLHFEMFSNWDTWKNSVNPNRSTTDPSGFTRGVNTNPADNRVTK